MSKATKEQAMSATTDMTIAADSRGAHSLTRLVRDRLARARCPHCRKFLLTEPPTMRVCKRCRVSKPISEMIKADKNAFGIGHICKACRRQMRPRTEAVRAADRARERAARERLSDNYVRHILKGNSPLKQKDFPPDLVALKRAQLKLQRSLQKDKT